MTGTVSTVEMSYKHFEVVTETGETFKVHLDSIECAWRDLKPGDKVRFDPVRLAVNARRAS